MQDEPREPWAGPAGPTPPAEPGPAPAPEPAPPVRPAATPLASPPPGYAPSPPGGDGRPLVLVRTYRGKQQPDANAAFAREAGELALLGYVVTSQSWAPGQWGCWTWLLALLLCVVLVGFLVFLYMLIVRPEGTLTVTYALRG